MKRDDSTLIKRFVADKKKFQQFFALPNKDLPAGAKLIYLNLFHRLGGKRTCWPSQGRIAKDTGFSERQVRNHLKRLERIGVIKIAKKGFSVTVGSQKKSRSSEYDLGSMLRLKVYDPTKKTSNFIPFEEELIEIETGKEVPTNDVNTIK